ncbi:MAG: hypothetical protein CM15mV145_150 [uncultured marine virus]|nr:MAG: hypothetical protein CM15mV145_150 [uncultured marine virus]
MCAPSRPSPPPAPSTTANPNTHTTEKKSARRVGRTLRQASPSQRGRGVLIRSKSPLGVNPNTTVIIRYTKKFINTYHCTS